MSAAGLKVLAREGYVAPFKGKDNVTAVYIESAAEPAARPIIARKDQ